MSPVSTVQLPASYVLTRSSQLSLASTWKRMRCAPKNSATACSPIAPGNVQIEAPGQLQHAGDRVAAARHEPLAIVEQHAGKAGAELGIAAERPACAARQHVDVAGLQRLEAIVGAQRPELHRVLAAEHRRGQRGAELRVEPGARAAAIDLREARLRLADTAQQVAAGPDRIEGRCIGGARRSGQGEQRTQSINRESTGNGDA